MAPDNDKSLVKESGLFDEAWYAATYPDVTGFPGGPLRHFMTFGVREKRHPNAFFNTGWYLINRSDVAAAGINPLVHYIRFGQSENSRPLRGFRPLFLFGILIRMSLTRAWIRWSTL